MRPVATCLAVVLRTELAADERALDCDQPRNHEIGVRAGLVTK